MASCCDIFLFLVKTTNSKKERNKLNFSTNIRDRRLTPQNKNWHVQASQNDYDLTFVCSKLIGRSSCIQGCPCPDFRGFKVTYVQLFMSSNLPISRLLCFQTVQFQTHYTPTPLSLVHSFFLWKLSISVWAISLCFS